MAWPNSTPPFIQCEHQGTALAAGEVCETHQRFAGGCQGEKGEALLVCSTDFPMATLLCHGDLNLNNVIVSPAGMVL